MHGDITATLQERTSPVMVALLEGLFDYAGLFPPAQLSMADAVRQYDQHLGSSEAWMLGKMVLPASRLDEFVASAKPLASSSSQPWQLSLLVANWKDDEPVVRQFVDTHSESFAVAGIETQNGKSLTGSSLDSASVYIELPIDVSLQPRIAACKSADCFAKIRTGGLEASAFPSAAEVAGFLAEASRQGVACKATAGLHHPLPDARKTHLGEDAPIGQMHGFINVVLAAALLQATAADTAEVVELLLEASGDAFTFQGESVTWRNWSISADEIRDARKTLFHSIGSCSFDEPISDLRQLSWL